MLINILQFLSGILIVFVVIAVHELGHLIVGLVQGFRFELFVVGPLGVKREKEAIKVYLNKEWMYYGGVASTLPIDNDPENWRKFANLLIAGPIASILLAIILGILYYAFDFEFSNVLRVGALASIGIFLATTIPNKTGIFFTDRKRYQRLTSDGPEKIVELAVLRVTGVYGRDRSYINVDPKDIELMIGDEDYKYMGLFTMLYYQREKFGKYNGETKALFDEQSAKMPKSMVKSLTAELDKIEN